MMKTLYGLAVFLMVGAAYANGTPPVLHSVLRESKGVGEPQQVRSLIEGFGRCDAVAALPKDLFAPLGVKYRVNSLRNDAAYPDLIESIADAPLVGNDVSALERTAEGKFVNYGAAYRLSRGVAVTDGLQIKRVKSFTAITPPRLLVGVTFAFNKPVADAIAEIDRAYGTAIKPRIEANVNALTAKTTDVWFIVDELQRSVTCWRYPNKRIIK